MSDKNDLLRRQDCIEAIEGITCSMSLCVNADECHGMKRMQKQAVLEIANMPPAAQPEQACVATITLTDEQIKEVIEKAKNAVISVIEPEPHEGHWIGGDGSYVCSECGGNPMDFIDTMSISFGAYIETSMNYCPHCGVKMNNK